MLQLLYKVLVDWYLTHGLEFEAVLVVGGGAASGEDNPRRLNVLFWISSSCDSEYWRLVKLFLDELSSVFCKYGILLDVGFVDSVKVLELVKLLVDDPRRFLSEIRSILQRGESFYWRNVACGVVYAVGLLDQKCAALLYGVLLGLGLDFPWRHRWVYGEDRIGQKLIRLGISRDKLVDSVCEVACLVLH